MGKNDALKAITKAIRRVSEARGCDLTAAVAHLSERSAAFAKSPSGQSGKFTPYPATWFNAGRYEDDETEWHNNKEKSKGEQRLEQSLAAIDGA